MTEHGLQLTAKWITPACQQRGYDVAWEDAVAQLKEVYDVQLARHAKPITLTLALYRKDAERRCTECGNPEPPGGPPETCPNPDCPAHAK